MKSGRAWILLLAGAAGCGDALPPPAPPVITTSAAAANPWNVLSAAVAVRVTGADSVAAVYHITGAAGADSLTPPVQPVGDSALIPVLGLLPGTAYSLRVIAWGGSQVASSDSMVLVTGALPADLPSYTASGADPSPGYVAFAAAKYGLVIDNTGRVAWYRRFDPNGPSLNFQAQPNGRYVALPSTPDANDVEAFVEVDPLGNVTRTLGCAGGLQPRFHDLRGETDGSYWLMCDEARTLDLSSLGGVANARVTGTVVQRIGADGTLRFQWRALDHFAITDLDATSRTGASVNFTHGNALDLDTDGNLIVSFRSLSEITKVNSTTGEVMWRLGGLRNQFTVSGEADPAFIRQHGVRVTGAGQLMLLDNLGDPAASRAERYDVDAQSRTARKVGSMGSSPGVIAVLGGTTQGLANGHVLVAFGNGMRVEEYAASGAVVWRIEGNPGYVFRAQRIASLYSPVPGIAR